MRKVFLEGLPKWETGKNKGSINWFKCVELKCRVYFIYDDIEGYIEIVDYKTNSRLLYIKYLNNEPVFIFTSSFLKGALGKALKKRTNELKIEIGQIFKDEKRDLVVIDREYRNIANSNWKYYKYKCNKCGHEGYTDEYNLIKGDGCGGCRGFAVIEGINDIPTTAPWMVKFFQGGYEEAKRYTKTSNKPIYPICPDCGRVKDSKISISNIYYNKSICCPFCRDGKSYPEKFIFSLLEKLCVCFKMQFSKSDFKWCDKYKYDFYFEYNNEKYIIETHGEQHYEDAWHKLKTTQENDRIKKELAIINGIKEENYIVIDCRKSELEWIKENIINSKVSELFDLSKIDWNLCEEFALSNRVKEACDLWDNKLTLIEVSKVMKLSSDTIRNYLKKGSLMGWCSYDPKEEMKKSKSKPVEVFKDDISFGIFESAKELERQSEELFDIKLFNSKISEVLRMKKTKYKGFTFQYI